MLFLTQISQGSVPVHFNFLILQKSHARLILDAFLLFSVVSEAGASAGDNTAKLLFRREDDVLAGEGSDVSDVDVGVGTPPGWWAVVSILLSVFPRIIHVKEYIVGQGSLT
jgi:hypothetical protein